MINSADKAKELLVHYFQISNNHGLNADNHSEIENIVNCIIEAAVYEIEQRVVATKPSQANSVTKWRFCERGEEEVVELPTKLSVQEVRQVFYEWLSDRTTAYFDLIHD
ncbi:MAG: hypothetical protein F6J96_19755 [Symploca sp. SIO1C2]|nr:hypothetical protein [Symploca sp. SIO1C2]